MTEPTCSPTHAIGLKTARTELDFKVSFETNMNENEVTGNQKHRSAELKVLPPEESFSLHIRSNFINITNRCYNYRRLWNKAEDKCYTVTLNKKPDEFKSTSLRVCSDKKLLSGIKTQTECLFMAPLSTDCSSLFFFLFAPPRHQHASLSSLGRGSASMDASPCWK